MMKSMTGFGRGEYTDGKRIVTAEIKSVNHRYCDIIVRMPRRYAFAEESIRNVVKRTVRRGKAEVSIVIENVSSDDADINLNAELALKYRDSLLKLRDALGLEDEIRLEYIASLPDVFKTVPAGDDEEEISHALCTAAERAAKSHDIMRIAEGERLTEDILTRSGLISDMLDEIKVRSPMAVEEYTIKLKERIAELMDGNAAVAEERILMEAAVFADKADVTEETVRLESHIGQLENIVEKSSQPDGKRLDFLVQEMNREANTIGSKANDIEIIDRVLDMKSEIEKIREQVQNLE